MKLKTYILPLTFTVISAIQLNADTFNEIVEHVADYSPELEASRQRMESEVETLKADNILADPQAEFERLWSAGDGNHRWNAGISQDFQWPGTYGARRNLIKATQLANEAQYKADVVAERLKIAQLLTQLIAANNEVAVLNNIHDGVNTLQAKYTEAWQHGETTIIDVNKLKIEAIRVTARLDEAKSRQRTLAAEIRSLCGLHQHPADQAETMLDFPSLQLQPLNVYVAEAQQAPELQALQLQSEVAQATQSMVKSSRYPGFSVGYSHVYEEGMHFNGLIVGVTLPIYTRKHQQKSAEAQALAVNFDIIARRTAIEANINADYANAEALLSQISQYGPVIESTNNLALLRKALDGGEMSLLSYLQEVNYFLEAQLDYIQLRKEYILTVCELNTYLPSSN
jgi:outer membrane protein TolC